MRRLLLLFILAVPFARCQTVVQSCPNTNTGTTDTVSCSIPAGHAAIALVSGNSTTATVTVANDLAQNFTQVGCGYATNGTGVNRLTMFWLANSGAGTSVTATWSTSLPNTIIVFDVSGMALSSLEDSTCVSTVNTGSTTSCTSPVFTSTNPNDLFVLGVRTSGSSGGFTAGGSYVIPSGGTAAANAAAGQYQVFSSIQTGVTSSISWVTSTANECILAAFKGTVAPSGHRPLTF